jgi:hypothetical protein
MINPDFGFYNLLVKMGGIFKVERGKNVGKTGQNWGQRKWNWKCIT